MTTIEKRTKHEKEWHCCVQKRLNKLYNLLHGNFFFFNTPVVSAQKSFISPFMAGAFFNRSASKSTSVFLLKLKISELRQNEDKNLTHFHEKCVHTHKGDGERRKKNIIRKPKFTRKQTGTCTVHQSLIRYDLFLLYYITFVSSFVFFSCIRLLFFQLHSFSDGYRWYLVSF